MQAILRKSALSTTSRIETVEAVLRPAHEAWIEESRTFLGPALQPGADVWARWSAVRYLADEFESRCRWERELVEELRPFIRADVARRLELEGDRFSQLMLELDTTGRRQGTAAMFATGGQELLDQLEEWCVEIEHAAVGISRDTLAAEGADLLAHIESAARFRHPPSHSREPGSNLVGPTIGAATSGQPETAGAER